MRALAALLLLLGLLAPGAAAAQDYGNPSGGTLTAIGDLRAISDGGARSWLDGGEGKLRFGADHGARILPIEGDLVWQPHLGWSLDATLAMTAQRGQTHAVDLSEAYLHWRHAPLGAVRLSARAGLFWAPVSLEHGGPAWSVTDLITPSAINSWVSEELKAGAAEVTASLPVGRGRLSATAALFGFNDTAGTLLAFRGWALHDEKATAFGLQRLPPLQGMLAEVQAPQTRPVIEIDHRPGVYAMLAWQGVGGLRLMAIAYDNRGDPTSVTQDLQWGWRTRFVDVGLQAPLARGTRLTAQAMTGSTRMGFPIDGRIWVDTRFRAAFAEVTQTLAPRLTASARFDAFGTTARGSLLGRTSGERGTAMTAGGRWRIDPHLDLLAEVLHVTSRRDERVAQGLSPRQAQTQFQLAARASLF